MLAAFCEWPDIIWAYPTAYWRGTAKRIPAFKQNTPLFQRLAYFAVVAAGFLVVATGWAIHKPAQLAGLAAIFGGFDRARVWHFWLMWFFVVFVIPHVVLVIAAGGETLRGMITGWSNKFVRSEVSDHEF